MKSIIDPVSALSDELLLRCKDTCESEITREAWGDCPKCEAWVAKVICTCRTEREVAQDNKNERLRSLEETTILHCPDCGTLFRPHSIWICHNTEEGHEEKVRDLCFANHNISKDERKIERAKERILEHFEGHSEAFWSQYDQFVLKNWKACVNEVCAPELELYYNVTEVCTCEDCIAEMNGGKRPKSDVIAFRKDILSRIKTDEEKLSFWHTTQKPLILFCLANFESWDPVGEMREFGKLRMSFLYIHLPLPKELENIRRKHIPKLIREFGSESTLLSHLEYFIKDRDRVVKENESLRAKLLREQENSKALQAENERLRCSKPAQKKTPNVVPSLEDKRKIKELEEMIRDMKQTISNLSAQISAKHTAEPQEEQPNEIFAKQEDNCLGALDGKTVAIIGGNLSRRNKENTYPCRVITHDGWKSDDELHQVLKESDIVIVLTKFIRHHIMWEVKEYCGAEGKPDLYEKNVNVPVLLQRAAKRLVAKGQQQNAV